MGGANSQVLLNETEMEAAAQGLRSLLGRFQVRRNRCCLSNRRVSEVPAVTCVQALARHRRILNRFSVLLAGARSGILRQREKRRPLLCRVSMVTRPRHTCATVNKSWNLGLSAALDLSRLIFSARRG